MMTTAEPPSETLKQTWTRFREENPKVRIRDAARELGVSEAELVATGCGGENDGAQAIRLTGPWPALIEQLPSLGRVMALTRNEHAVHERKGEYRKIEFFGPTKMVGNVLGPDIDLRLFLRRWHLSFAVREETPHGARESLQFFDQDGSAIHKIYLEPESNRDAFARLVAAHRAEDQQPGQSVIPAPPAPTDAPDAEIDCEGLRAGWNALQDTHGVFALLKEFRAGRMQALRLIGAPLAVRVHAQSARAVLESAAADHLPIMVFVGSAGVTQIHTGPVGKIAPSGEWINVLDPDFNLHLRESAISQAWVVRKPTRDGVVTSLEVFDADGEMIVQFFGKRKPGEPELPAWTALAQSLCHFQP